MADIVIIAAMDEGGAIGNRGGLLCHLSADLRHFKQLTTGHAVIMGRKTFESLPNGALPNRRNIVLSTNPDAVYEGCETFNSLDAALDACASEDEVFVIGGGAIYALAMEKASRLEITHISARFEADTYFPKIEASEWEPVAIENFGTDDKNRYPYSFVTYRKCLNFANPK